MFYVFVDRQLTLNVDSGWLNEQLQVSSVLISKMLHNYHIAPKHAWTCKDSKKSPEYNKYILKHLYTLAENW